MVNEIFCFLCGYVLGMIITASIGKNLIKDESKFYKEKYKK